ncbi:MAG: NnrS family protein, partial [Acetobacteraceae bacterium]
MTGIPRYREWHGPALLSAGFRPFFLGSAVWALVAIPLWLALYDGSVRLPIMMQSAIWHPHEMVFGFAAATVAGFMLTAIPNWTGRMPLQGWSLLGLVLLWAGGRIGVLISAEIGPAAAMVLDLAFPVVFLAVVAREVLAGRNWRNLPMVAALASLLLSNLLVHLQAVGVADTAMAGNRWGIATVLMLISVVGGRIIPSFTRNWLARERPEIGSPAPFGKLDYAALTLTAIALVAWIIVPEGKVTSWLCLVAGVALAVRLSRWQGLATLREPLLWVLHLGYGWL